MILAINSLKKGAQGDIKWSYFTPVADSFALKGACSCLDMF
jgi:hypothetical protein